MRDFKKERTRGRGQQYLRMATGLALLGVLMAVVVGSAGAAWSMYGKFVDASAADASAQAELADMRSQYASVSATVAGLGTDRGLEAAVRERYGVGKPGEGEIDIVRQATSSGQGGPDTRSWWARLWQAIVVW